MVVHKEIMLIKFQTLIWEKVNTKSSKTSSALHIYHKSIFVALLLEEA